MPSKVPSDRGPPSQGSERRPGFQAQIKGASLADLVQMECLAGSHRVVRVTSAENVGFLYFRAGAVVHATARALVGEAAPALDILSWNDGSFEPVEKRVARQGEHHERMAKPGHARRTSAGRTDRRERRVAAGVGRKAFDGGAGGTWKFQATPIEVFGHVLRCEDFQVVLQLDKEGSLLVNRGGTQEFADIMSYVCRLAEIVGTHLGTGAVRGHGGCNFKERPVSSSSSRRAEASSRCGRPRPPTAAPSVACWGSEEDRGEHRVETLRSLRDVQGVYGSFVVAGNGTLVARDLPPVFDGDLFAEVGPRVTRLYEAFLSGEEELERGCMLRYAEHKLYLRKMTWGVIGILSTATVNLPALRMIANLVSRKIDPEVTPAMPSPTPPQAFDAAPPPVRAPDPPTLRPPRPSSGRVSAPTPTPPPASAIAPAPTPTPTVTESSEPGAPPSRHVRMYRGRPVVDDD